MGSAHRRVVSLLYLRCTSLLQANGTLGLIATNTVAQGDTREVGLDAMVAAGFTITRAIQSRSWPASSANLEYASVWGTIGPVADDVPRVSDDIEVGRISTLLEPAGRIEGVPAPLRENEGRSFIGCYALGMGFVLDPEEAQEWIAADARNAEVLFPYLNGEDLNTQPDSSASRWVIDFNDWGESRAATYTLPYQRICDRVKPERQRRKPDGSFALRKPLPERWWQYAEKRPAMRKAIAELSEVLVIARISKTVMPLRIPTGSVMNEKIVVLTGPSYSDQALLSSSLHLVWAVKYSSTLETRVNYSPSDVFLTFPRPKPTPALEEIGRTLDQERREIMLRRQLGITKLYNLVNDPHVHSDADVLRLRDIHVEIDLAVASGFGWDDIPLSHGFHVHRQMERWTVSPSARVEVLDRLLAENRRRAADQDGAVEAAATDSDAE